MLFSFFSPNQPASYGKKVSPMHWHWKASTPLEVHWNSSPDLCFAQNGLWHQSPGNQGWGGNRSRKSSVIDADNLPSSSLKPSAGRVIRIINNNDHSVQVRLFLNPHRGSLSMRGNYREPWRKAFEKFKFNYSHTRLAANCDTRENFSFCRALKFAFFVSTTAHKLPFDGSEINGEICIIFECMHQKAFSFNSEWLSTCTHKTRVAKKLFPVLLNGSASAFT